MTMTTILITGNTYPVKDQIKALGGRWDADMKGWRVPADKAAEAQSLVSSGGTTTATQSSRRPMKCRKCGIKAGKDWNGSMVKIRRDGQCWDCASDS